MGKEKILRCEICNLEYDYHMHDCSKTVGMYYGCLKCDNYCDRCKKKKNNREAKNESSKS